MLQTLGIGFLTIYLHFLFANKNVLLLNVLFGTYYKLRSHAEC